MQAIGGAMFEAIRFENGRILNPHFAEYRVPRFTEAPQIEVEFVERKDLPTAGAGETPLIGLAPTAGEKRSEPVSTWNTSSFCHPRPPWLLVRFLFLSKHSAQRVDGGVCVRVLGLEA